MAEINKKPVKKTEENADRDPMFWVKKSSFAIPPKEEEHKGINLVGIAQKIASRNYADKMGFKKPPVPQKGKPVSLGSKASKKPVFGGPK